MRKKSALTTLFCAGWVAKAVIAWLRAVTGRETTGCMPNSRPIDLMRMSQRCNWPVVWALTKWKGPHVVRVETPLNKNGDTQVQWNIKPKYPLNPGRMVARLAKNCWQAVFVQFVLNRCPKRFHCLTHREQRTQNVLKGSCHSFP